MLSGEAGAVVTEHLEDVVEAVEAVKGNVKVATTIIIIYTTNIKATTTITSMIIMIIT